MVNKTTNSASKHQKQHGEATKDAARRTLKTKIKQLTNQVHARREKSIKEKVQRHSENLKPLFSKVNSIISRRGTLQNKEKVNMLSSRINKPICKHSGFPKGLVGKDCINKLDIALANEIRIPYLEKLPPYTTWVYLTRNIRMAKDQSVIGKRQIYYDKIGGEIMICSDSEEEMVNLKNDKHDFTEAEDLILRMTLEEYESTEEVLIIVKEFVKTTDSQIQERYEKLKEKHMGSLDNHSEDCHCKGCKCHLEICLEKSLSATLESFDNLFCRQCLIFDCPMHATSQPVMYHSEKQQVWSEHEGDRQPCSDQCYLLDKRINPIEGCHESLKSLVEHTSKKLIVSGSFGHGERDKGVVEGQKDIQLSNSTKVQANEMTNNSDWKHLEKDLYLKGVKLFGKNSCLIAHNLLPGFKTCLEVARYMLASGESMPHESIPSSITNRNDKINEDCIDQEIPSRSSPRKKLKTRKFSFSQKSIALSPRWKRVGYGKDNCNKQYTPCGCQGICTQECSCLRKGTYCEKYCGCSKLCDSRFKGCYCVKGQCRSELCLCFASNRECDPDVCQNCWVSCNDGSSGEPPRHEDGQCENMNLLLGKKERILLSKSNVAGWGAFAKNPIIKNICLGEYTGELITHKEAEKRGKLYDHINNSYLFNINDQWVIDARRFGNKLKFTNHSLEPNCYAKVMLVGGDHRVGIFAKENIKAGDELFYHYYYHEKCTPPWALPPKEKASKAHELNVSQGMAKKHLSD
ncbi:Histone-lysine N-methyltransferase EZA1 isoform A [Glycine soja]|uniref:[histone H3]-lysine(27) N-trimethyltransferase n=2 Tax=Glycine soja TaxID=3848 RepID=A0A445LFD2_GLYSO|nr:Histone-lysine N-methyltransferase EZA1 isoform A [Glycine soja]